MINQSPTVAYSIRAGLGRTSSLAALIIPLVCGSCFFATKSDFDRLQQDVVGTRASTNAADSVQRAYLIEVTRSVRTLTDSINALSRRVNALKTTTETDLTAMKEDISQLQDLSGQSEQRLRDMRAALEDKTAAQPEATATLFERCSCRCRLWSPGWSRSASSCSRRRASARSCNLAPCPCCCPARSG